VCSVEAKKILLKAKLLLTGWRLSFDDMMKASENDSTRIDRETKCARNGMMEV
jgi:hypothetical protein